MVAMFNRIPILGRLWSSLRFKVALGIGLPVLAILLSISFVQYTFTRQLLERQVAATMEVVGDTVLSGVKNAMVEDDRQMIARIVNRIAEANSIDRVMIVGLTGEAYVSSDPEDIGVVKNREDAGCRECHRFEASVRPQVARVKQDVAEIRISAPIMNVEECQPCHGSIAKHLGVLLIDAPATALDKRAFEGLMTNLALSILGALLAAGSAHLLLHWRVVKRIERFNAPLSQLAAGDYSSRVPLDFDRSDVIARLASAFNSMASEVEKHAQEQEEISTMRYQAIVDERRRLARELHDGLGQLLGYVTTKAAAARIMLRRGETDDATIQLHQLEDAAKQLSQDVRIAITGLKMSNHSEDLGTALSEYATQLCRMTGMKIETNITEEFRRTTVSEDIRSQLLRITQEALTNVCKHSRASLAEVELHRFDGHVRLLVKDNGIGFDVEEIAGEEDGHFGLTSMKERTEAISGTIRWDSAEGAGTVVTVEAPLKPSRRSE